MQRHTPPPFKQWFPWLVPTFVVANVVLFIITMYINDCPKLSLHPASCFASFLGRFSFQPLKQNPLLGPSTYPSSDQIRKVYISKVYTVEMLVKLGALYVEYVVHLHQVWRLFASMWLHGGVVHLLLNMLGLLYFGIHLEKKFGYVRIGLLYIISGLGSSLLSGLFTQVTQPSISIGASGAICGLMGGLLSELLTNWTIHPNKISELLIHLANIILSLAFGILPINVDNFGHIGGVISGFLLGFVLLIRPQYKSDIPINFHPAPPVYKPYQFGLLIISFVLLSAGLIGGMILLLKEVNFNDYCLWCHYLSCVPISKWKC
ncbi:hypothetical protein TSUD_87720 [Trifolium subterraneum]|uniref:RHOMBOID-like protein n=1 Tax=Trifolium subterraneum TaxID=3900 RepID=A0A2Z6PRY7_TRISU|nr:hypothetical protein TSUD_87720 [Trifolium subterraneum]